MGDFNTVCYKNVVWPDGLRNEFLKCHLNLWLKMVTKPSQFIFPDETKPLMHTIDGSALHLYITLKL